MEEKRIVEGLVAGILVVFLLIAILLTLGVVDSKQDYEQKEHYSAYKTVISEYTVYSRHHVDGRFNPYHSWGSEGQYEKDYQRARHVTVIEGERYSLETLKN